jgi:hypothetical protein
MKPTKDQITELRDPTVAAKRSLLVLKLAVAALVLFNVVLIALVLLRSSAGKP